MATLSHTPGPWYHEVGVVYGPNEDGTGFAVDNPADAPLIAAAPELLDGCIRARSVLKTALGDITDPVGRRVVGMRIDALSEVIAKARNEAV